MDTRWQVRAQAPETARRFESELLLPPCVARLLAARGFTAADEVRRQLHPSLAQLSDPSRMPQMDLAADRILLALRRHEKILVHGDYDVDGLSGSVLLHRLLQLHGAETTLHIPHRREGYSLGQGSLEHAERGRFTLCLTVDHGTASPEGVAALRGMGCDVIIVDHHQPDGQVPPATAVLNPALVDSPYPFPHLTASGVAFQLANALTRCLCPGRPLGARFGEFLLDALGLVALGTVTDQAPLIGENRVLVRHGLRALTATRHPGLRALLEAALLREGQLTPFDISTRLGPRLNAAGRMGSAMDAARLLLAHDYRAAMECADRLEAHNRHRRQVEREVTEAAIAEVERRPELSQGRILVLAREGWHPGVMGSVANRICIHFQRPALLIALEGEMGRGSGRAPAGFDLRGLLEHARPILHRFGGHRSAVGLEVQSSRVEDLRRALDGAAPEPDKSNGRPVAVDARADFAEWDARAVQLLARLGPASSEHPEPVFLAEGVQSLEPPRVAGNDNRDLVLRLRHGATTCRGVMAGAAQQIDRLRRARGLLRVAYSPRLRQRAGAPEVELLVFDLVAQDDNGR